MTYALVGEPKKAEFKMTYSYEQCTNKDRKHTTILVAKDGEPSHWLCIECGSKQGVMRG